MTVRRSAAGWWALALALVGGVANAEERAVRASLHFEAAPGTECLSAEELREGVEAHLAREVFVPEDASDVGLRVRAARARTNLLVQVDVTTGEEVIGSRVLETPAARCASLRDTLVLVVAMMLDVPLDEIERRRASTEVMHRVAPLGGRAGLGIGWKFR